jgi:hypothetical protein
MWLNLTYDPNSSKSLATMNKLSMTDHVASQMGRTRFVYISDVSQRVYHSIGFFV